MEKKEVLGGALFLLISIQMLYSAFGLAVAALFYRYNSYDILTSLTVGFTISGVVFFMIGILLVLLGSRD